MYGFQELSEAAKEFAISNYCENLDFHFHAQGVIRDVKNCARILGVDIDAIYYSGFSSQGDGACFVGDYEYKPRAVIAIIQHAPDDTVLQSIAVNLQKVQKKQFYKIRAKCSHTGYRYYHSGCMEVSVYHTDDQYRDIGGFKGEVTELLRGFADWVYEQLKKEYWNQVSENAAIDYFDSNNCEFYENGRLV